MLALWNHIRWSCSLQKHLSAWQDSHLPPSRPWAALVLMHSPQVLPCSEHQSRLWQSSRRFVRVQGVSQILGQNSYVPIVQQQQDDPRGQEMKDAVKAEGKSPKLCLICLTETHWEQDVIHTKQTTVSILYLSYPLQLWVKVMFSFSCAFDAWI